MGNKKNLRRRNWIKKAQILETIVLTTVLIIQQGLFGALEIYLLRLAVIQICLFVRKKFKIYIKEILIFLSIIVFICTLKKYIIPSLIKSFVKNKEIFIEKEIEIIKPVIIPPKKEIRNLILFIICFKTVGLFLEYLQES